MELVHGESGFAIEVRRHLHRFPELSLQEYETSAFLQQHLSDFGIKFQIVGRTGIYGYVEGTGNGGAVFCCEQILMHCLLKKKLPWPSSLSMLVLCMPVVMIFIQQAF